MKVPALKQKSISLRVAVPIIGLMTLGIGGLEWRQLYALEHPKPQKMDCISCHSDKKTLAAIADKSGDDLYLVHNGNLTLQQLNRMTGKSNQPAVSTIK
ncbi:MAG TPA: hypothetical protein VKU00_22710 [Chthonomonadaceae bacterium]|nr:hypothetical protein [Chthonomonadaceae bacterium]